jgi:hypothetical protein
VASFCPRCGAELPVDVLGATFVGTKAQCPECQVVVDRPAPVLAVGDDEDELDYELDEWGVAERGVLTAALVERGVPYRWEGGLTLVVRVDQEDLVDSLLDDLEDTEWDGDDADDDADDDEDTDDEDGGEEAQTAMSDLFVAADRLAHHPDDGGAALQLLAAAEVVDASPPPYGVEAHVWERVGALAEEVTRHLDGAADEDAVAASARTLRDFLRGYV